jgi:chaperone modulatory protein CbpM
MTISEQEVLVTVRRVTVSRLRAWVGSGLVRPQSTGGSVTYSEADVARLCLICELSDDLEVSEETLPVVLSLIDQIHGLRRQLKMLGAAVEAQPRPVQDAIREVFQDLSGA